MPKARSKEGQDKTRGTDEEILKLFYDIEELSVKDAEKREDLPNKVLIEDAVDPEKGLVVARAFEPLSKAVVKQIAELGVNKIKVVDTTLDEGIVIKCMKKDPAKNEEEALKDIYRRLRPGDPPTAANARALIKRLFFDPKRYDLGRVGRYKINQKLGIKGGDSRILTKADLVAATKYLLRLKKGEGTLDDIDHLGSRRVRTVGELLANQCRVGLARTERLVKERMTLFDQGVESMSPQKLINPKALSAVIRDFFGRSQLSQFMDQINPLAELTHKRRLSALGPGGLSRDRAGFEVRDVHPSHYGRICPIETPEGPNIGLITSLATFARINEFGFLETPYRKVEHGKVTEPDRLPHRRPGGGLRHRPGQLPDRRQGPVQHRPRHCAGQGRRLPRGRAGAGRLHGRFAQAARLRGRQPDSVPGARRRQPRADGLEHAAPGRAAAGDRSAARRHRPRGARRPRLPRRHRGRGSRQGRLGHRQPDCHHRGRQAAGGQEEAQARPEEGHLRLPGAQVHALQRRHLHQPEDRRQEGRDHEEGPGHRRRSLHPGRRTGPGPQRARRVHALERLQLRGRHPDQRAHREGGHLHLDPH